MLTHRLNVVLATFLLAGACAPNPEPPNTITPPRIFVSILETGVPTFYPGTTHTFEASVTGTSNDAVSWSTTIGTIDNVGVFTAPDEPGQGMISATSVADASESDTYAVEVLPTPTPQPMGGFWRGTWTSHTDNSTIENATAIALDTGETYFCTNVMEHSFSGFLNEELGAVTGTVLPEIDGEPPRIEGTVIAGAELNGVCITNMPRPFAYTYDPPPAELVNVNDLVGAWQTEEPNQLYAWKLQIGADGAVSGVGDYWGGDDRDANLAGTIELADPTRSIFRFKYEVSYPKYGSPPTVHNLEGLLTPRMTGSRRVLIGAGFHCSSPLFQVK